ncbi:MAG: uncharacterized protein QOE41_1307 [Mycobacterium sp.]|nr:Protein of unknown function transrane [Mycobacterium sp.]MDT5131996.1 uncharacterized protein [Mycobacterium sp.]
MTHTGISWDYTTRLNIAVLILAVVLVVGLVRTCGVPMLRMMGGSPDAGHEHHGHHQGDGSPAAGTADTGDQHHRRHDQGRRGDDAVMGRESNRHPGDE